MTSTLKTAKTGASCHRVACLSDKRQTVGDLGSVSIGSEVPGDIGLEGAGHGVPADRAFCVMGSLCPSPYIGTERST